LQAILPRAWVIDSVDTLPAEVMEDLAGNPSYSTVRTQLRVLEEKGHVRHDEQGLRYVYVPAVPRRAARKSA